MYWIYVDMCMFIYIYKYIYNKYMYSIRKFVYHAMHCIYILHLQVVSQRLIDRDPEEDSGAGGPPGVGGRAHEFLVKKAEPVY